MCTPKEKSIRQWEWPDCSSSAVGEVGGCLIKAGGVPCSTPGVQCCEAMTSGFEMSSMILISCQTQPVQLQPVPNVAWSSPLNSGYQMFLGRVEVSSRIGHTQNQCCERGGPAKAGGVPCSTAGRRGGGSIKAGGVPCSIPDGRQCCLAAALQNSLSWQRHRQH